MLKEVATRGRRGEFAWHRRGGKTSCDQTYGLKMGKNASGRREGSGAASLRRIVEGALKSPKTHCRLLGSSALGGGDPRHRINSISGCASFLTPKSAQAFSEKNSQPQRGGKTEKGENPPRQQRQLIKTSTQKRTPTSKPRRHQKD